MKRNLRHKNITKRVKHKELPLSRTKKRNRGFDTYLLNLAQDWLDCIIKKYSKSFYVRLDIRYPETYNDYIENNIAFSRFLNVLRRAYWRNKDTPRTRIDYFWVREQDSSNHHHYHLILALDGNIVQNEWPVMKEAARIWELKLGLNKGEGKGLVHLQRLEVNKIIRCYHCDPKNKWRYEKLYESLSYLAKVYSKRTPKGQNEYGHSRIKGMTIQRRNTK